MAKLTLIECSDGCKVLHVETVDEIEFKLLETFWKASEFGPGGVGLHGGCMSMPYAYIRIETKSDREKKVGG